MRPAGGREWVTFAGPAAAVSSPATARPAPAATRESRSCPPAAAAASRPASVSSSGARQAGRPARTVNSSRTAGPPATRTTSATSTIRRVPSAARSWRTTRSMASAIWSRIAASGRPTSAIKASVSSRRNASAALPA